MTTPDSSHRKILFLAGLIIVLLVLGTAVFFAWRNNAQDIIMWIETLKERKETETEQEPPQDTDEECPAELSGLSDQELMAQLYDRLNSPSEIVPETNQSRIVMAEGWMIDYLACKLRENKDEAYYQKAKDFANALRETSVEAGLNKLDESMLYGGYLDQVALGNLDELCPEILSDLCRQDLADIESNWVEPHCNTICDLLEQYAKDADKLRKDLIEQDWNNDPQAQEKGLKEYHCRRALAYRFGGQDLALEVCNKVNDSQRENCLEGLEAIIEFDNESKKGCEAIRESLKVLLCAN